MLPNFASSISIVLVNEGGAKYVNNADDKGGPTRFGISLATLSAYRKRPCTADDMQKLPQAEAEAIYKSMYWTPLSCEQLGTQALATAVLDCGVLCGTANSAKFLQTALCVTADGSIGPKTIAAVCQANSSELLSKFSALWQHYLIGIAQRDNSQVPFLVGWLKRAAVAQAMPFLLP